MAPSPSLVASVCKTKGLVKPGQAKTGAWVRQSFSSSNALYWSSPIPISSFSLIIYSTVKLVQRHLTQTVYTMRLAQQTDLTLASVSWYGQGGDGRGFLRARRSILSYYDRWAPRTFWGLDHSFGNHPTNLLIDDLLHGWITGSVPLLKYGWVF